MPITIIYSILKKGREKIALKWVFIAIHPPFSILAPSIACLNINKKQENEKNPF
jgi:hypothetical protein